MKNLNSSRYTSFQTNQIYAFALLAIITLMAFALRFYKLGEWSFWGDEMYTLRASHVVELGILRGRMTNIATHFVLVGLETNELSARLFPALVGVASIPLLFFPLRNIFGSGTALIATLLLAFSPWHIYWSQNARFYTLILLLFTFALLTFYLAIENDHLGYLALTLVLIGLASREHLTALIFGPIAVSYLVILKILPFDKPPGLRPRNILILLLPGLVLGLFIALPHLRNPGRWLSIFGYVNNSPFWVLAGIVSYIGIPTICLGAFGALYAIFRKSRAALLVGLAAMMPLLAIAAISLVQYSANRYAFVSLTSWLILAAIAAWALLSQLKNASIFLAVGVAGILILTPLGESVLYYKYQNGNRDNWKEAFALVREQKLEQDLVVVPHKLVADYYLPEETICMCDVDLTRIRADNRRAWFVEDMTMAEKYPDVHQWIKANTRLVANLDVHFRARNFKMRVHLYAPDELGYNIALDRN